jgi:ABC-type dipeptide/oligopeptide/nickel transport system ATPase subunit
MRLTISYPTLPLRNSVRASQVMDYFGISHEAQDRVLAVDLDIPLRSGDVVLFTGASGSGKSSLLNALVRRLEEDSPRRHGGTEEKGETQSPCCREAEGLETECLKTRRTPPSPSVPPCLRGEPSLLRLNSLDLGTRSIVDAIDLPFEEALQLLALCGLAEAPLLLRTPQELSEGQRYRFALALAVSLKPHWIVADEFTAVLDRITAQVIAYNVRRVADRYGIGFLLATALDDVAEDLKPDLLVTCDLDGRVTAERREVRDEGLEPEGESREAGDGRREQVAASTLTPISSPGGRGEPAGSSGHLPTAISHSPAKHQEPRTKNDSSAPQPLSKKKEPRSPSIANSGSASPPSPTGRTSLGGIIAATRSA